MAKRTNFLSIALLVSLFAVVPAFAADGDAASFTDKVAAKVESALNLVDYANPFEYAKATKAGQAHSTVVRAAVYASVVALVATNSHVQSAANSVVDAVKNALGMNEDDSEESNEPTRLVIGRQA